jgi:PAS domain S-box-containing protein
MASSPNASAPPATAFPPDLGRSEPAASLSVADDLFRWMFEQGPLAIAVTSLDGTIVRANPALGAMLGVAADELAGKSIESFSHPDDYRRELPRIRELLDGVPITKFEKRYLHKDGHWVWGRVSCSTMRDGEGRVAYVTGIVENITEQKAAEDSLRQSEQRYQLLTRNIRDVIWACDLYFHWTYISPSYERLAGFTPEEAMGLTIGEIITPESARRAVATLQERLQAAVGNRALLHQSVTMEIEYFRKGGGTVWGEVNVSFVLSDDGNATGLIGVTRDISSRKMVQAELARAKELAEAASRAKSEFLANMSHEIRTPMTAILGFVDVILAECPRRCQFGSTELAHHCHTIARNAGHLLEIINDILDLSKIEAGEMRIAPEPSSPSDLADDVVRLMADRAKARDLELSVQREGPIPAAIRTDPIRLRQVLINLVGNAVKFTERGGVTIVLRIDQDRLDVPRLRIEVRDTGIGIHPSQLRDLFRPFTQADGSTARQYGGTGLGLAISKRLVEMLGGEIWATSQPGVGSTFTVTIPTGPLAADFVERPVAAAPAETPKAIRDARPQTLAGKYVLLAEDGIDNQRLFQHVLTRAGAEVVLAENGREAVDRALAARRSGRPFDVVLMDMQMPVLDGYEATRILRAEGWRNPIFALTAHAMNADRDKCLHAGCDDYMSKPIDAPALLAAVANAGRTRENP